MINWDPAAQTALSDEEVIFKEVNSKLYHVRYLISGTDDEYVTIATTRPETILGDTAICINPEDERYMHLKGKKAIVPLIGREIPIIFDEYVDMEFGTGCLKVTPAHDVNDFELGEKYGLEIVDVLNPDGTMSEAAQLYIGEDRFKVRKLIAKDLDEAGNLISVEDYRNKVGYSERTDVVIEPRLSLQWWVAMEELSKPAFENVMNDNVQFHPSKFKNSYRNWMENIKDWCISRQLWWGQRIPAYYFGDGDQDYVIARTADEALEKARQKSGNAELQAEELKQDEDVLDTWFSSWLWPIAVFNGFKDKKEVEYYYPTSDLVTAPEIMFFWVARMIIAGYEYMGEKPFSNVYYTGIVRDLKGRKMSKSLGNSPDPLELIKKYGADGVRVGMLFSSPAGNDLLFDEKLCEQGRNFSNKIWNAFRFLTLNMEEGEDYEPSSDFDDNSLVDRWMAARIHQTVKNVDQDFANYRPNDALKKIYSLLWDDFFDWYIELIKPAEYGHKIPKKKLEVALGFFEDLMRILHPFMPFITEEIWQYIDERKTDEALIVSKWPEYNSALDRQADIDEFQLIQKTVSAIRNIRAESGISPKAEVDVLIHTKNEKTAELLRKDEWIFRLLVNISELSIGAGLDKPHACGTALVDGHEVWIPLEGLIDTQKEKERLQKEIARLEGFLKSVEGKMTNPKFVDNAPEAVV
jgi:valyl-tRNA synthetase